MTKKKEKVRIWVARAYCSKCNKLLMESNPFTKKELKAVWDKCLIDACGIICRDCKTTIPNFNLNIKIYNSGSKLEFEPKEFFPTNSQMQQELDDLISTINVAQESIKKKQEKGSAIEDAEIVETI